MLLDHLFCYFLFQLRMLFDGLKNSSERRDRLRNVMPNLVAAAEQNNFGKRSSICLKLFTVFYICSRVY